MKRLLIIIISIIAIISLLFLIHLERTEWVLREKVYDLDIPLSVNNGTIDSIEKQVKKVIPDKYANSHLCEIKFIGDSNESFETFTDGEIVFVYYENLGNANGFYNCERFALCEIHIDLQQELITRMRVYGNSQICDLEELETYPEINEIRNVIYGYCENSKEFESGYTIVGGFVNILNDDTIMSSFTIELAAGTQRQKFGKILKLKNEYQFLPFER